MIANNSSGARAPIYGLTADHVVAVDAVLADGRAVTIDRESAGAGEKGVHAAPLALRAGETLKLRVLVDRSSVEVFAQDGRVVLTDRVFPDPASLGAALEADGPARLVRLDAWRLAPSVPYSPADSASAACTSR